MYDSSADQIAVFVLVCPSTLQTVVHHVSKPVLMVLVIFCCVCFQGHPVLLQVDNCIIHVSWATAAACPEAQTAELDKCRVFDNSTGQYYSLKPLEKNTNGLPFYQVV